MSITGRIDVQPTDTIKAVAAGVTLQPEVILLLLGNFDAALAPQVRSFCARALAPMALMANALLVDDGSSLGLAAQIGLAAHQVDVSPMLLGIHEPAAAEPDPNHPMVICLPAEWPDPVKSSFLLTAELARSRVTGEKPVIALLFGGADAEKLAILRCARRNWPIFIVQGAGGLGDALLAALAPPPAGAQAIAINDPDLREILDTATVWPVDLDGNTDDLKQSLLGPVQQPRDALEDVWSRYDDLDRAAVEKQSLFRVTQLALLSLTVTATLLAIVITGTGFLWLKKYPWIHALHPRLVLHILLILVPISISMLASFSARFREGNKWVLLRAAAESIKREIFRYRTRSGIYSEEQCNQPSSYLSAQSKLSANTRDITANLAQSEVNRSSIPHEPLKIEGRTQFLNAEDYILERIDDQITYFLDATGKLYHRLKWLQICILLAGGLGTFLAAMHVEVWVALTTALATAFTSKLEIDQVENSLVQYNISLTSLQSIKTWWKSLSVWEKMQRKNIDLLVDQTEKTLEHETAGWVQQMQSTLDKLMDKESNQDRPSGSTQGQ